MPLAASTAMPERLAPRASIHSGDVAKQMPDLHTSHARPTKPGEHAHCPGATHAPWPEQWACSAQLRSAHPAPSQPGSHAHTPAAVQLPCPWQPSGQPATW